MKILPHKNAGTQHGFVLATSLIFLVVITLLAVSAINSSTLQERMASNQRDRSRALQAANAGLNEGARFIYNCPRNPDCDLAKSIYTHFRNLGIQNRPSDLLRPGFWKNASFRAGEQNDLTDVHYFIVRGATSALNETGNYNGPLPGYYTITARAVGENPAVSVVTQGRYKP